MTNYEELKLAVYESGLDQEDIEEIIDIMESCDDDELQDVCESVEDLLVEVYEASKEEADRLERQGRTRRDLDTKYDTEHAGEYPYPRDMRKDEAIKSGKYGSQYERMTPEQKRRQDIRKATSLSSYGSNDKKKPADKFQKSLNGHRSLLYIKNPYTKDRSNTLNKLYDKNKDKYDTYRKTHDYGYSDDPKANADIIREGHAKGKKVVSRSQHDKVFDNYMKAQDNIRKKLHNIGTKSNIMDDMKKKINKKLKDNQTLTPREQEFKDKYPKLFESACLDLYEACDNGDITIEERDYYLEHVSELFEEE